MKAENKKKQCDELRTDVRKAAIQGASVEFKPSSETITYQFKLWDWSSVGLSLLAKKESDIFHHIEVGQVFAMKVHMGNASLSPERLNIEIRHISEPVNGLPENHLLIGLFILGRTQE